MGGGGHGRRRAWEEEDEASASTSTALPAEPKVQAAEQARRIPISWGIENRFQRMLPLLSSQQHVTAFLPPPMHPFSPLRKPPALHAHPNESPPTPAAPGP